MLAANTCAADFMLRSKHIGLYRVHEGPTPEKLQSLREFLKTLGLSLGGGADPTAKDYGALLDKARARPDYGLLQTMCLRSMQQAIYGPDNAGHFGLSYPAYTHFTSPIRRYPDLMTHRVIKALLKSQRYQPVLSGFASAPGATLREYEHDLWEKIGLLLSGTERRADDASRDVEAWLKCWFVKERVGEVFSGRVTGVASFGIFVTLDTLHVEGLVHVSELGTEYFQFNDAMHELRGDDEPVLTELLSHLDDADLVLVEGFKRDPLPKLEVHRPALGHPLLSANDPHILAVACDAPVDTPLPTLDLNDPIAVARFVVARATPGPDARR
jgi:ribonuclease R